VDDAAGIAGHGPELGDVGGSVVGHDFSDGDAAFGEPGDGPVQEPDGDCGGLVGQDLDIGQAGRVVDGDVDGLPPGLVGVSSRALAQDSLPGPGEASEGLDVEVDQLAGVTAAVPVRGLGRLEAGQPVEPDPGQHRADRRDRQAQLRGDHRAGPAQPAQRHDRRFHRGRGPGRRRVRPRGPIRHRLTTVIATQPDPSTTLAHVRRLRGLGDGPALEPDPLAHQQTTQRGQTGISVDVHRAPWGRERLSTLNFSRSPTRNNLPGNYT